MRLIYAISLIIVSCCLCLEAVESRRYHAKTHAGMRSAVLVSPTTLHIYFGPGLRPDNFKDEGHLAFQIASEKDTAFHKNVHAKTVKVLSSGEDATYPAGYNGPKFKNYVIEAELDSKHALKPNTQYWAIVANTWLLAKNKAAAYITKEKADKDYTAQYGIREVTPLAANMIRVQCGAGIDLKNLKDPSAITISDASGVQMKPLAVYRKSNLDFYIPAGWPWQIRQRHELFLKLPITMVNGQSYVVNINANSEKPSTCGRSQAELMFDDKTAINYAIKNNHYGYLPDAERKYAYVGAWMGDGNAYDFASYMKSFSVRDAKTHKEVMQGKPTLRNKAVYQLNNGKLSPDPKSVKGKETVYKQDLSYEDVYQLDLSALSTPGTYYIAIEGLGRGFEFKIAKDVYAQPFEILMNGIYHQRSGCVLQAPHADVFRPASHRNMTQKTNLIRGKGGAGNPALPKHVIDGKKLDIYGGHYDAGDWEPRSHIDVAEQMFVLYEINSKAFTDGQLNIPENKNGIPDILDEGFWAFDLWNRLQDQEDGGVHNGTESIRDPLPNDRAHTDTLANYTFAKQSVSSYRFAAVSAQASIIWRSLGKTKDADRFLKNALRAFAWAEKNPGGNDRDVIAYASAVLLRATGDDKYKELFKKNCILSSNPNAAPNVYGKHDQIYAFFHYAKADKVDSDLKAKVIKSFENDFNYEAKWADTASYRYLRSPYAPNTWGTGGLPKWLIKPGMCMHLTEDKNVRAKCKQWIQLTSDFSLGCHPMGIVFSVGLGQRYVTTAWHHLQKMSPVDMIPGLQTEGAGGRHTAGPKKVSGGMGSWPGLSMYPYGAWPDLYKYSENASPGMNEGVVATQAKSAFAYGLLLAAE